MSSSGGSHEPRVVLQRYGLNVTAQRLAVLRAVAAAPHSTAIEIGERVRDELGGVSPQAVYDALAVLTERGALRRLQSAGAPARYEDRVADNHHHLICRACGAMVDVDCVVGAAPCLTCPDDTGYVVDEAEVVFWGLCPTCRPDRPDPIHPTDQLPVPTASKGTP